MGNYVSTAINYYYGTETAESSSEHIQEKHVEELPAEEQEHSDTDSEREMDTQTIDYSPYFIRRSISYIHPRSNILYLMNDTNKNSSTKMKTLRQTIVNHLDRNKDKYLITKDIHVEKVGDDTDRMERPDFKIIKDDMDSISQLNTHLESLQILRKYSEAKRMLTFATSIYIDIHNSYDVKQIYKERQFSKAIFDIIHNSPKYNSSVHNFVNVSHIHRPYSSGSYAHYYIRNIYEHYNFVCLSGLENDTTNYMSLHLTYTPKWFFESFIDTVHSCNKKCDATQYASNLYKTYEYLKSIQKENEIILFNVKNTKLCLLEY